VIGAIGRGIREAAGYVGDRLSENSSWGAIGGGVANMLMVGLPLGWICFAVALVGAMLPDGTLSISRDERPSARRRKAHKNPGTKVRKKGGKNATDGDGDGSREPPRKRVRRGG
jgi:hypothetical protein